MKFLYFLIILMTLDSQTGVPAPLVHPKRIISTSLASDEILVLLKTKQLQDVVALSNRADLPEESNVTDLAKKIVGRFGGEPESIVSMSPDLVIAAVFNRPELLAKLRTFHIPVLVLKKFDSFADIASNIEAIGAATGERESAAVMRKSFEERLTTLRAESERRKAASGPRSLLIFTGSNQIMAGETVVDEIVNAAGAENLATKAGLKKWPTVNPEKIATWAPDFVLALGDPVRKPAVIKELKGMAGWRQLVAVKKDRVVVLPQRFAYSLSPFVLNAVEELQKAMKSEL